MCRSAALRTRHRYASWRAETSRYLSRGIHGTTLKCDAARESRMQKDGKFISCETPLQSDTRNSEAGLIEWVQERGKRVEIRDQWADVFRELRSRGGTLVLLRSDRDGDAEDCSVDGFDSVRFVHHAARRASERSHQLKDASFNGASTERHTSRDTRVWRDNRAASWSLTPATAHFPAF